MTADQLRAGKEYEFVLTGAQNSYRLVAKVLKLEPHQVLLETKNRNPLAIPIGAIADASAIEARRSPQILQPSAQQAREELVSNDSHHPPRIITKDRVNVSRDQSHEFDLPIRIHLNKPGSDLYKVSVALDKHRGMSIIGGEPSIDVLRSGQTATLSIRLRDGRHQSTRSDVRINAHLTYRTRDGKTYSSPQQTLTIRVNGFEAHAEIPNPFHQYAGGLPVVTRDMFFGRESLIDEIVKALGKTPGGTCFAVYGQQRTGKSSVLSQVRNRLTEQESIVAALSMGTLDRNSLTVDFVEEVLDQFRVAVDRLLPASSSRLLLDRWPNTATIAVRPLRSFQRALEAAKSLLRSAGRPGVPFVVVVDEFTYIHEILRRQGVDPAEHNQLRDFMRQLKGLLEARLFTALLIGQDTMPRFLASYPNEFSVMSTRKLDYLTPEETQSLADLPVRTSENTTRYTGYALNTIASYTGGHPFFTQILCDRTIELANSRRHSDIAQSDIEEAVESLVFGKDSIEPHRFDCLITADNTSSLISDLEGADKPDGAEQSLKVLTRIARLSGSQNSPVSIDDLQLDARQNSALQDLILRGVLHHGDNSVFIRVLLFADYLRRTTT